MLLAELRHFAVDRGDRVPGADQGEALDHLPQLWSEPMPTLGARRCRLQPVETPRPVRGIPALKRPQARTAISRDRSQRDVVLHVQPEQCPTFLGANAPTLGRGIRIRRGVHQVTLRGRPAASAAWLCWGLG